MNMWNFTLRGLLKPIIDGDEELFKDQSTSIQRQDSVTGWTSDNIKLESDSELNSLWDKFLKGYILCLLHDGLNRLPAMLPGKSVCDMSEIKCNQWLLQADVQTDKLNAKISIPDISIADTSMSAIKSDIHVLPLSLEDNSTPLQVQHQYLISLQMIFSFHKSKRNMKHFPSNKPRNMSSL